MADDLAAGLFDPDVPDAEFRRAVAVHLLALGFDRDDVRAIARSDDPEREANQRLLFPGSQHTQEEFAARLVDAFEGKAFEVIATHDARLVKLIGDAVMFTALDADAACDIALTLVEQFADEADPVTPRGALAMGEMLVRGGDYYGPLVNLAARAADLAVPYETLVSEPIVTRASDAFHFEPAGRRMLKGFTEPVVLASLSRA